MDHEVWVIEHDRESGWRWSNEYGWTEESYDIYTDEDRIKLPLPIGGYWRRITWHTHSEN